LSAEELFLDRLQDMSNFQRNRPVLKTVIGWDMTLASREFPEKIFCRKFGGRKTVVSQGYFLLIPSHSISLILVS
jgi:hypothetical protein